MATSGPRAIRCNLNSSYSVTYRDKISQTKHIVHLRSLDWCRTINRTMEKGEQCEEEAAQTNCSHCGRKLTACLMQGSSKPSVLSSYLLLEELGPNAESTSIICAFLPPPPFFSSYQQIHSLHVMLHLPELFMQLVHLDAAKCRQRSEPLNVFLGTALLAPGAAGQ